MISNSDAPRPAILITYADCSPFIEIVAATHEAIWADARNQGIDIYYVSGKPISSRKWKINAFLERVRWSRYSLGLVLLDKLSFYRFRFLFPSVRKNGQFLEVQVPSGLRFLGLTVLASSKYLVDMGYTHVYKTTTSSVVNIEQLKIVVSADLDDQMQYAGSVGSLYNRDFVSGANLLMNKRTIDFLYQERSKWKHEFLDDVAISRILESYVEIQRLSTLNIHSLGDLQEVDDEQLANTFHFRCKSLTSRPQGDILILNELMRRKKKLTQ